MYYRPAWIDGERHSVEPVNKELARKLGILVALRVTPDKASRLAPPQQGVNFPCYAQGRAPKPMARLVTESTMMLNPDSGQ